MAVTNVAPGAGLNAAIAAASAGDVLRLSTGSYTGDITLKDDVHIAAAYGQVPDITGEITSAPSGSAFTTIRDCTISGATHVVTADVKTRFEYCTFTATGVFFSGASVGTYMFVGCTFNGGMLDNVGASVTMHGCYSTDGLFADCGAAAVTYTYNTVTAGSYSVTVAVVADTLTAANNVLLTPSAGNGYFTANSGTISHNVYANVDDLETAGNCTATGNRAVTDARLRTSGRLRDSSPARAIGGAPGTSLPFGRNRIELSDDAGCFAHHGHTTAVYAHWTLSDPTYGLNLSDVARGAFTVTLDPATFVSPFDTGAYIADLVFGHFTGAGFTWGVTAAGAVKLVKPFRSSTGNLTTNNHTAAMFGVTSATAVNTITLGVDRHLALVDLAWEAPPAPVIMAQVDRMPLGQPSGAVLPTGSTRRFCSFTLHTLGADRSVFNLWFSGTPVRIFRRWDETDLWTTTNDEGYDDLTAMRLDTGDYPWYTPTIEAYEIRLEGVAKDPA